VLLLALVRRAPPRLAVETHLGEVQPRRPEHVRQRGQRVTDGLQRTGGNLDRHPRTPSRGRTVDVPALGGWPPAEAFLVLQGDFVVLATLWGPVRPRVKDHFVL
jgi:hypothetical protein